MQPCTREMQAMALQELQNAAHDDFFDQMLSSLPPSWPDLGNPKSPWDLAGKSQDDPSAEYQPYDESSLLASRLRQHQISGGGGSGGSPAGKAMGLQLAQHQQMMLSAGMGRSSPVGAGDGGLIPMPLSLGNGGSSDSRLLVDRSRDEVDAAFKPPNSTQGSEGIYNGFSTGSAQPVAQAANQQHFQGAPITAQGFGAAPPSSGTNTTQAAAAPPRQRVRARRGQATDPHSIAERLRRERIAERMKALQELVPNANKTDKASMLDEIIDYVKFLQLQVKVLSMSRLGGAAAVAPLVADVSSEAGRSGGGGGGSDSLAVTEHQVAKLMEEDMGSAMQYLQGKGLCLMPISLASAISSATTRPTSSLIPSSSLNHMNNNNNNNGCVGAGIITGAGDGPSSPSMSVLTVQSAMGAGSDTMKDAASVSKP